MFGNRSALHIPIPSCRSAHRVGDAIERAAPAPIKGCDPAKGINGLNQVLAWVINICREASNSVSKSNKIKVAVHKLLKSTVRVGDSSFPIRRIIIERESVAL